MDYGKYLFAIVDLSRTRGTQSWQGAENKNNLLFGKTRIGLPVSTTFTPTSFIDDEDEI